jgi:hypothetical protein
MGYGAVAYLDEHTNQSNDPSTHPTPNHHHHQQQQESDVYAEIGEVVLGKKKGREGDELILVDLTGTGAQVCVCVFVYCVRVWGAREGCCRCCCCWSLLKSYAHAHMHAMDPTIQPSSPQQQQLLLLLLLQDAAIGQVAWDILSKK